MVRLASLIRLAVYLSLQQRLTRWLAIDRWMPAVYLHVDRPARPCPTILVLVEDRQRQHTNWRVLWYGFDSNPAPDIVQHLVGISAAN